jgi:hypothetical protein
MQARGRPKSKRRKIIYLHGVNFKRSGFLERLIKLMNVLFQEPNFADFIQSRIYYHNRHSRMKEKKAFGEETKIEYLPRDRRVRNNTPLNKCLLV